MELYYGSVKLGTQGHKLWARIKNELLSRVKVLNFTRKAAIYAGQVLAALENQGQVIGIEDIMIAAIALASNLVLVTDNTRHLQRIEGLTVENWLENT